MPSPQQEDNLICLLHLAGSRKGRKTLLKSKKMVRIHKLELMAGQGLQSILRALVEAWKGAGRKPGREEESEVRP
jgi:hypothetical protein